MHSILAITRLGILYLVETSFPVDGCHFVVGRKLVIEAHQRIGRFRATWLLSSARSRNFELLPTFGVARNDLLHLDDHFLLG